MGGGCAGEALKLGVSGCWSGAGVLGSPVFPGGAVFPAPRQDNWFLLGVVHWFRFVASADAAGGGGGALFMVAEVMCLSCRGSCPCHGCDG